MAHHSSIGSSRHTSTDLNLVSLHELSEHTQDVFKLIARRAFETFESRGHVHGHDQEDWFLAESELLTPVKFHISESGDQLTARAEVPAFDRQEIKVSLEPRRLIVSGKSEPREDHQSGKHGHSSSHAQLMLAVIDLPTEVDLSKAMATLNNGGLVVVMPKAAPAKSLRVEMKPGLSTVIERSIQEAGVAEAAGSLQGVTGAGEPMVKVQAASSSSSRG